MKKASFIDQTEDLSAANLAIASLADTLHNRTIQSAAQLLCRTEKLVFPNLLYEDQYSSGTTWWRDPITQNAVMVASDGEIAVKNDEEWQTWKL